MTPPVTLRVDGLVVVPRTFTFDDLRSFSEAEQVRDFTRFHPKRAGDGVTLRSILDRVTPTPEATYLTLHAKRDDFAASIPLAAIVDEAVVVYQLTAHRTQRRTVARFDFLSRTLPRVARLNSMTAQREVRRPYRIDRRPRPRHSATRRAGTRSSASARLGS